MSGGSNIGVREALFAVALLGFFGAAAGPAWGQGETGQIAEDELSSYVDDVFQAYNACDTAWFSHQLSPSADIQVTYANGEVEGFTAEEYVAKLRAVCRPFQLAKWDRTGLQVTTGGSAASAVWKMGWGGRQGLVSRGSSALRFTNRITVVREDHALRITSLDLRAEELIAGAEQAYWSQTAGSGILDLAIRFYNEILIRMRNWRARTGQGGTLF
jgi:hypothetical protein